MARSRRKPIKYYSPKRRAVYEQGDDINHYVLFEMHGWICCLCRQKVNKHLRHPNFMAATVEHLIPISMGGTHTWDNVAVSHAKCNFDRGNSLLKDSSGIISA